jgi:Competence-damaged protein
VCLYGGYNGIAHDRTCPIWFSLRNASLQWRQNNVTLVTAEFCTAANSRRSSPKPLALPNICTGLCHLYHSCDVAAAMAEGALARSPANMAVSFTGVAGPDPDEDGNTAGANLHRGGSG